MTRNGGASDSGVVFKVKKDGTLFTKLHDFAGGPDGRLPYGSLIFDGTFLYGMTAGGGMHDAGIIFKLKPDGSGYSKLYDFGGSPDGKEPMGSLFFDGTWLYGTTWGGGANPNNQSGTVFKIMPDGSNYQKLHDFAGGIDGSNPNASLISDGTYLYGTTGSGATMNFDGCLFKIKPDGTSYSIIVPFASSLGRIPCGSVFYDGTYLYGTLSTGGGGGGGGGTLFKVMPDGTGFTDFYTFFGSLNGSGPMGDLISVGSYLYGTTYGGGNAMGGWGTLFKIQPNGSNFLSAFSFNSFMDGQNPVGSLVNDGNFLYGMTNLGGSNNKGVIFSIDYTTVGIAEQTHLSNGISISPNPNNGKFTLYIKDDALECALEVYDALGQSIYKNDKIRSSNEIDLSQHSNGIYYIHVQNKHERLVSKLIVQH